MALPESSAPAPAKPGGLPSAVTLTALGRLKPGVTLAQAQGGGRPVSNSGTRPADADHDGRPDIWETAHGLDPNAAADSPGDRDGDGCTNPEENWHSLKRCAVER